MIGAPGPMGNVPAGDIHARLRRTADEFEAVFLSRLFHTMQETAIHSSLADPSQAEQTFRSLLDDRLASEAAVRLRRGIGEELYRSLCRRLPEGGGPEGKGQE